MSGDVQPRKRKDKKRKKEEGDPTVPSSTPNILTKEPTDDVNIHVHKEEGTGGGICAKIIFFILFSALIVLIGLIITEHRGLTDLDVADSESKYSQIFEGWVDEQKHDDHHTLDDHDNAHFDDEHEPEDDVHTLDDHDNEHIDDDEETEDHSDEHTLDDHDNEHFDDDDEDEAAPESDENEEQDLQDESRDQDLTEEESREKLRHKREISEEDEEDDNLSEDVSKNDELDASEQDDDEDMETEANSKDEEEPEEDTDNLSQEKDEDSKPEEDDDIEESEENKIGDDDSKGDDSTPQDDSKQDNDDDEEIDSSKIDDEEDKEDKEDSKGIDDDDQDDASKPDLDDKSGEEKGSEEDTHNISEKSAEDDKDKVNNDVDDDEETDTKGVEDPQEIQGSKETVTSETKESTTTEDKETENGASDDNPGSFSYKTPSPDIEELDSEKLSDDNNDYEYSSTTNKDDWPIRKDLDEAQRNLPNNAANALKMFEKILEKYPSSPRGFYGLAQALDRLAEVKKSNDLLEEAIENYLKVSDLKNVPDALFTAALERCIDRMRFRGRYGKAVKVHLKLINRFSSEPKYSNQLAITYLTIGKVEQARLVLKETLQKWPHDGCALVHYGFIYKTTDNNLEKGINFMERGIQTKDPCVLDGRFYFHLGDAYSRLGQREKALKLYEDGVKNKLFLSKYQRSLYNVPRLKATPWWKEDELQVYQNLFMDLTKHWKVIREEGLSVLNQRGYFQDESENLRDTGDWKQFELFARGRRNAQNCNKTPVTCKILQSHPNASSCRRGQTKFSVMHPGTHVWAHCGPTNCRLRVHLGLKVPPTTYIRVADELRSWEEGKLLIFDDSFEHEVWHNGTEVRLVLIVDVWHPELSYIEKQTLSSL